MPADLSAAEDAARPSCSLPTTGTNHPSPAGELPRLPWMDALIAALRGGSTAKQAIAAAGVALSTAYIAKRRRPAFAAEWHAALAEGAGMPATQVRTLRPTTPAAHWRRRFLDALAESSNVSAQRSWPG